GRRIARPPRLPLHSSPQARGVLMSWQGYAQILFVLGALVASVKPLGAFMARVFEGEPTFLDKPLGWLERLVYRLAGVPLDVEKREMKWTTYAGGMLLFNGLGIVVLYVLQRLQGRSE